MEKLLELENIKLLPSSLNNGFTFREKFNFALVDEVDRTSSLPIFASSSVTSKDNCSDFNKAGIKPILPIEEDLNIRLEGCEYLFTQFTVQEVRNNFLRQKRAGRGIFKIFIYNNDNGHSVDVLNTANELKKAYGAQVDVAAGNLLSGATYEEYCKAGIDYGFAGMGETFDEAHGFYCPLASILIDINGKRNTINLPKKTKVVACGVSDNSEILKTLALGADYVLVGRPLAKTVEASGSIYKIEKTKEGTENTEISKGTLLGLSDYDISCLELKRMYCVETRNGVSGEVKVSCTLEGWTKELYKTFSYGFMMTDSSNWNDFHKKVRFGMMD